MMKLDCQEVTLTDDQRKSVENYFETQRHGPVATGFTLCEVEKCPYYKRCPYVRAGVDMETIRGNDCPVEQREVKMWMNDLAFSLGIEENDTAVLLQVRSLAMAMLEEKRCREALASESLTIEGFKFMTLQGHIVTEPKEHPLQKTLKEIEKRKSQYLKQLMATPEMRAKDRASGIKTLAESMKFLKDKLFQGSQSVSILQENPIEDWDKVDQLKAGYTVQSEDSPNSPSDDDVIDAEFTEKVDPDIPDVLSDPPERD